MADEDDAGTGDAIVDTDSGQACMGLDDEETSEAMNSLNLFASLFSMSNATSKYLHFVRRLLFLQLLLHESRYSSSIP